MKVSFWFIINFLIFLVCLCESALTPEIKEIYSGFLSGKGLYNVDDGIVLLNSTNFNSEIYGKSNAWLVEFYNSWCGHCHKFAPVFRSLASNLQEWRRVLQLAALDCSVDENTSICRDYDIMGYPTLKFFSANSPPSSIGTELVKTSNAEEDITRDIVGVLQKEQLEGRGNDWPNIIPYRNHEITNLWTQSNPVRYIFLIFTDENDPLASEVILDLSNVENIEIRGVASDNEVLSKSLGIRSFPSVVVMENANQEPEFLKPNEPTRVSFRLAIKSFLKEKGFTVPNEPKPVKILSPNEIPSILELQEARDTILRLKKIKALGDVVFLVDLENTIRFNLEREISRRKNISGEAFDALNKFLEVLAKYFPFTDSGYNFIRKLQKTVLAEDGIKGIKFRTYLSNLTEGGLNAALSTKEKWVGCQGSSSNFRGFPCGMWTMFHYFTVNALERSNQPNFNPLEVLQAMLGYVTHFFGCSDCSKHFQEMARNRSMKTKVKTAEEAVLWLWSAHNVVNKRLSGDETEDPEFPKIQFPSEKRCSECRDSNGEWDEGKVLNYLKSVYSQDKLNKMHSNTKLHSSNGSDADNNYNLSKSEFLEEENLKKIGKDFNIFDISLCVVLYVVSAVICVGVCLKFVLKKRYRKKSHSQDLLGRV